ncbi:MAG: carboxypeptidase-like regulatory domain-containing protein [Flavisolibacter sp.]|jgi:hypothetical protein
MKFKLLLLTLAFSASAVFARANNTSPGTGEETKKNDIAGGVIHADTKKPLSNVSVTAYSINKKEKVVLTDASGNYSFSELKPGTYKLIFEKEGFRKVTREKVTIRSDEGYLLNIEMSDEEDFKMIPQIMFSDLD